MELWRISRFASLDGEGGRLAGARWNSAGLPVVYLAASPAGALVEILVQLELAEDELPPNYKQLRVAVPDALHISQLRVPAGEAWKADAAATRKVGDAWLRSQRSALARVPSALLPHTFNYLLNPLHPDAGRVKIAETLDLKLDSRLLR